MSQKCAIPVLNPFLLIVDLDQTPPPWVRTERATPEEPSSSRKPMDSPRVQRYTRMEPMFSPQRLYGDWSPMCPGKIPISQSLIPISQSLATAYTGKSIDGGPRYILADIDCSISILPYKGFSSKNYLGGVEQQFIIFFIWVGGLNALTI